MFKKIRLILDGAMGTELQKLGMPAGVCTDIWAMDHKKELASIYKDYAQAGAQAVLTSTFGANAIKLRRFGRQGDVARINEFHVRCAKKAVPGCMVGGDIGPTGEFLQPIGEISLDEMIGIYAEQAAALANAGADFIIIETMMDVKEARAAVLGAKSACKLPVVASVTFSQNGRTLTGSPPECAAIALQAAGADVVGTNCGAGPEQMQDIVRKMAFVSGVPIIAQPNAGMPKLVDGRTVYDMSPEDFAAGVKALQELGAQYVGGCCGTTPEHISEVAKIASPVHFAPKGEDLLCNDRRYTSSKVSAVTHYNIEDGFDEQALEEFAQDTAGVLCLGGKMSPDAIACAVQATAPHVLLGFSLEDTAVLRRALREYCGRALVFDLGGQVDCINEFGALKATE